MILVEIRHWRDAEDYQLSSFILISIEEMMLSWYIRLFLPNSLATCWQGVLDISQTPWCLWQGVWAMDTFRAGGKVIRVFKELLSYNTWVDKSINTGFIIVCNSRRNCFTALYYILTSITASKKIHTFITDGLPHFIKTEIRQTPPHTQWYL